MSQVSLECICEVSDQNNRSSIISVHTAVTHSTKLSSLACLIAFKLKYTQAYAKNT